MSNNKNETPKKFYDNKLSFYAHAPAEKKEAQQIEITQQEKVSERYFRIGKPIRKPATQLLQQEILEAKHTVNLDNHSARAVVIAISKVMNEIEQFPNIKFRLGNTTFNCIANPTLYQIGNMQVRIENFNNGGYFVPPYEDQVATVQATQKQFTNPGLMAFLNAMLGHGINRSAREKKLASLLLEKSKRMQGFALADFNSTGFIRLDGEQPCTFNLSKDINFVDVEKGPTRQSKTLSQFIHILNFINFMHVIAEVSRRLYRDDQGKVKDYPTTNAKKIDEFPVASFHARVLKLIIAGKIEFSQLFANGKPYGVVTGIGTATNFATILAKAFAINSFMSDHHHEIFPFKTGRKYKDHYLQSRPQLVRQELGDEFGGASESSDHEYDSLDEDIDFSMASEEEEDLGLTAFEDLTLEDIMKTFESPKKENKGNKSPPNKAAASTTQTTASGSSSNSISSKPAQLPKQHMFHNHSPAAGVHELSNEENNQEHLKDGYESPTSSS